MIFGMHPVAFWIATGIAGALALTPLIFLALQAAGKVSPELRGDLWTRYKSWLVLAPLMVVPLLLGRIPAILGVAALGTLCYREFARVIGLFRHRAVSGTVALGGALITYAIAVQWYGFFNALTSLVVCAIVIVALFADDPRGYIQRVALGIFCFLLFGVCLGHFSYLANDKLGAPIQLAILLCVELNDIFAYCTGKAFGRRKLSPHTSPKKDRRWRVRSTGADDRAVRGARPFYLRGRPAGSPDSSHRARCDAFPHGTMRRPGHVEHQARSRHQGHGGDDSGTRRFA